MGAEDAQEGLVVGGGVPAAVDEEDCWLWVGVWHGGGKGASIIKLWRLWRESRTREATL